MDLEIGKCNTFTDSVACRVKGRKYSKGLEEFTEINENYEKLTNVRRS